MRKPDVELQKDMGEYVGYRKRDVKLWNKGMFGRFGRPYIC